MWEDELNILIRVDWDTLSGISTSLNQLEVWTRMRKRLPSNQKDLKINLILNLSTILALNSRFKYSEDILVEFL